MQNTVHFSRGCLRISTHNSLHQRLSPYATFSSLLQGLSPHAMHRSLLQGMSPHETHSSLLQGLSPHATLNSLLQGLSPHKTHISLLQGLSPHITHSSLHHGCLHIIHTVHFPGTLSTCNTLFTSSGAVSTCNTLLTSPGAVFTYSTLLTSPVESQQTCLIHMYNQHQQYHYTLFTINTKLVGVITAHSQFMIPCLWLKEMPDICHDSHLLCFDCTA